MYLKSIEIQGFKSFANRILFEFHDGITGIVGPNGSGKSNVADAVRWVLGEQSAKQLRGSRMEDVIFSGTQLRKPQGYACVEITFNNADHKLPIDFDEVKVARKVYRSGESEYLLNGSSCRLKDVQELFFDTGIGKEGYSIIGQGQIEKILSGKPEERRELFDEAAGIVKYKKRKAAAEKQLEEEKLNYSRVADILSEIEKQLGPLEKQQNTAREYLKLKEELKILEVNAFLSEQEKQEGAEQTTEERIRIVQEDLSGAEKEFEKSKSDYERFVKESEDISLCIEENRTKKNDALLDSQQKENEIKLLTEQISSIHISENHYMERKSAVVSEQVEKQKVFDELQKQKEEVDENLLIFDESMEAADNELEEIRAQINGYTNEIENRNEDVVTYLSENGSIRSDIEKFRTIREQNQIRKAELTKQVLKTESDNSSAKSEEEDKRKKLEEIDHSIERRKKTLFQFREQLSTLITEQKQLQENYEQLQQNSIREQSRLESLRNLSERYEGYGNGTRRVMECKDREKGILGAVADIFQVERKYETAIETALGGSIQNVVTDTETTAKRMIEFLKQNKAGRVTFLPLDAITVRNSADSTELLKEQGVIGYASELVKTELRFQEVIRFLLGRTIVTDHIQNAILLARKYKYSLRIVTLEGEQLNPGGSISGGAFKNSSNLLSRKREVEEADDNLSKLKNELFSLVQQRSKLQASLEQCNKMISEEQEKLQQEYINQNTAKLLLSRVETRKKDYENVNTEGKKELLSLEQTENELNETLNRLMEALTVNEEQSKRNRDCIEDCNHMLSEERRKEHYAVEKCESIRLERNSVLQKQSFLTENINRVSQELSKLLSEEERLQNESKDSISAVCGKEEEMENARLQIAKLAETIRNLDEEYNTLSVQREETGKKHRGVLAERDRLSERKQELDKELFRLTERQDKIKEQIESLNTYMWDEYELTYSEAQKMKTEEIGNPSGIKRRINENKSKIKALGTVNVNSIEEYKECFERHSFLSKQRDDLQTARDNLLQMIAGLDEKMRLQFSEKFEEIKKQFDIVFSELFGGGKGTLELAADEDILSAGVLINAQPPGKKLQNMMQLSGGEKALTAISLLFAIQNLKPSPFCLLDEIEAALDDSNVKRYAGYLHKLIKHTQFIVITHRRGTMTAADVLYGITMQEKGVSTLVSVSLIEDKLEA